MRFLCLKEAQRCKAQRKFLGEHLILCGCEVINLSFCKLSKTEVQQKRNEYTCTGPKYHFESSGRTLLAKPQHIWEVSVKRLARGLGFSVKCHRVVAKLRCQVSWSSPGPGKPHRGTDVHILIFHFTGIFCRFPLWGNGSLCLWHLFILWY